MTTGTASTSTSTGPIRVEEVLAACGVTESSLADSERASLDRSGYVVLEGVADDAWRDRMRAAFERLAAAQGDDSRDGSGTRHLQMPIGKDDAFDAALANPRVLAAVFHVLGRPFQVLQFGGRDPLPGFGQQGLHADWMARKPNEPFAAVTAIWMIDDFTGQNGATRVVPASHRLSQPLPKSLAQPEAGHPYQILITAAAGSVLVMNGHLWHSGTRNRSHLSRRALQCQYVARELARPFVDRDELARRPLTPAARYLLGL